MRIVIIGGVAAGMSAAAKAKRMAKNSEVIVYEKGSIVSFGACGLPYYVGDFFDNPKGMIARTPEQFRESGVEVNINHEVLKVDVERKIVIVKNLVTDETFESSYDKLMVATGANAILPPVEGLKTLKNIFTLKSMDDGISLKKAIMKEENKEIVVIGAGYIGIEVVEAAKNLGKNVRVIQQGKRMMSASFDSEITDLMEKEVRSHGVELHLEEIVKKIEGNGVVERVITDKGEYSADIVVVATGVRPATGFLEGTGIEMDRGAIIIDEEGKTSVDSIYSAGDCAVVYHKVRKKNVYIPLATTANKIGRVVGENLAGAKIKFNGTLGSACIKVMDLEAGRTGITETEAKLDGINYKTVLVKDKNQTNYYPGQENIFVKLIYDAETKVILGGQIIGKNGAVLRVDVIAMAVAAKMKTSELGMMDFCYSPPFARTWDVLNVSGNVAK
ncbi:MULTISPECIES: CoA-disulfide reductase [Psychrilyobacter]|uniref:CoA-disulfide reductase n=1 Tax=Psychrilyobacter piezotolerans TaxID=2293438 RepID=A0ABX9KL35_9FUSO|nr:MULTISPECIES: CoA-disulfide reductase [Psychrilyobacter]MCS5422622.1 CoA-disulfide reductase [Psychrilyobacter sp. S5]NDI76476.1 CoA-disulfide reductase [Psychrilyobacter piezotolerans]RDE66070.1 CoA-disulfide reductase [Psychrilyobacter sp. S5]REI43248.1 CoA-disulfide reductase [Psychrilyobacter piezotolerans]